MSIRFGRSRTCLRREKLVRARGAATLVVKRYSLPRKRRGTQKLGQAKTFAPCEVNDMVLLPRKPICGLALRGRYGATRKGTSSRALTASCGGPQNCRGHGTASGPIWEEDARPGRPL